MAELGLTKCMVLTILNFMHSLYHLAVKAAHRGYKLTLSPYIGQQCRLLPTCSDYMRDALIEHGPLTGAILGLKRIGRCRPGGPTGYDPVPPKQPKT